jgi:hypothetical protein
MGVGKIPRSMVAVSFGHKLLQSPHQPAQRNYFKMLLKTQHHGPLNSNSHAW